MNAVVVLTRGYSDIKKYDILLKRNEHIRKNIKNKNTDILIFHEGNITPKQQIYIKNKSKLPRLKFVSVERDFKKKTMNFYKPTERFGIGYRNMCSFWFVGFWKYTKKYKKILRIDEDCYIDCSIDEIFKKCNNKVCVFGAMSKDYDSVTKGMNKFTLNFLAKKNIKKQKTSPEGPYTNLICFNLEKLRKNKLMYKYIENVKRSNKIYVYRWGDLPLWGEVLKYMYNENDYLIDKNIKYFHQSHNRYVNEGKNNKKTKKNKPKNTENMSKKKKVSNKKA